jgi:hypothetical protein
MNHADVQAWLDRYVEAWRANEREPIEQLFTEDATYGYRPWDSDDSTARGRDAIVATWLEEPDEAGTWEAQYEPWAVEGDRAVAVGWSRYAAVDDKSEKLFHNAYLLEFAPDGRCRSFNEFYMEREVA